MAEQMKCIFNFNCKIETFYGGDDQCLSFCYLEPGIYTTSGIRKDAKHKIMSNNSPLGHNIIELTHSLKGNG